MAGATSYVVVFLLAAAACCSQASPHEHAPAQAPAHPYLAPGTVVNPPKVAPAPPPKAVAPIPEPEDKHAPPPKPTTHTPPPPAATKPKTSPPPPPKPKTSPPPPPQPKTSPPPPPKPKTSPLPPPKPKTAPPPPPKPKPSTPPPPPAPEKSYHVAVEGVVYCRTCKLAGYNKDIQASPIPGAIVKLQCNSTYFPKAPYAVNATSDKNGYYLIYANPKITSKDSCRVYLVSSPLAICKKPSNYNGGVTGSKLRFKSRISNGKTVYNLYTTGMLIFDPTYSNLCPNVVAVSP